MLDAFSGHIERNEAVLVAKLNLLTNRSRDLFRNLCSNMADRVLIILSGNRGNLYIISGGNDVADHEGGADKRGKY